MSWVLRENDKGNLQKYSVPWKAATALVTAIAVLLLLLSNMKLQYCSQPLLPLHPLEPDSSTSGAYTAKYGQQVRINHKIVY